MNILQLRKQGLSISDIARHSGRDRKTIRKYINQPWHGPAGCVLYSADPQARQQANLKGSSPKYTGPATDRPALYSLMTNIRAGQLVYRVKVMHTNKPTWETNSHAT